MRWNVSHLPGPLLHKLLSPGLCAFPTQLTKLFSLNVKTLFQWSWYFQPTLLTRPKKKSFIVSPGSNITSLFFYLLTLGQTTFHILEECRTSESIFLPHN